MSYSELLSKFGAISFQQYVSKGITQLRRVKGAANFISSGSTLVKRLRRRQYLFIYLFNTLFQEGDAISYMLFLLAALRITTTICTIYTKSHSHEYSNKTRNSQYIIMTTTNLWCVLTSRFLNEDIVFADLTAVGNLFQI